MVWTISQDFLFETSPIACQVSIQFFEPEVKSVPMPGQEVLPYSQWRLQLTFIHVLCKKINYTHITKPDLQVQYYSYRFLQKCIGYFVIHMYYTQFCMVNCKSLLLITWFTIKSWNGFQILYLRLTLVYRQSIS